MTHFLEKDFIDRVSIHSKKKSIVEIDYKEKEYFYVDEFSEKKHKTIHLKGEIRSLDKKTNNGKFVDSNGETYNISLIMENPESFHRYYVEKSIQIEGVATINQDTKEIERIEVEKIK